MGLGRVGDQWRGLAATRFFRNPLLGRGPAANRALTQVVPTRLAMLSPEIDDLEMATNPGVLGKQLLEVRLSIWQIKVCAVVESVINNGFKGVHSQLYR